ncbi:hypothetical protein [Mucilaginibacter antarcticus]|uniref:hypothetical protein n=1 Tax=Mucilaginibacter antarcticus TaxID=1855725 RepID=UPI00363B81AA
MRKAFYFVLLIAASGFISCKKDKKYNGAEPSKDGSAFDLIKDSVYLYAQETYYWHDGLPGYAAFNPE